MHNLVKIFLTSIKFTFDNLSRKIKNPCLVINKNSFFKEEIIMYNFKKLFTYMVVGALVMALSISCKNDETNPTIKYSDLVGTWMGSGNSFTISSSGYVNFTYEGTTYDNLILDNMDYEFIEGAVSSFNSGYSDTIPNYVEGNTRKQAIFYFHSSSSCTVTIREEKYSGTLPNGSWQTQNTISVGNFTK